jgi:hypothetical protein
VRVFTRQERFLLYNTNTRQFQKVNGGKEALLKVMNDQGSKIEAFISSKKLKCKSEDDWKAVINYYNTLVATK